MPGKKSGITDLEGGREKRVKKKKKRSMPGYRRRWRVGYKEESDASKGMRESASNHEFNAFYDVHEPSFTVRVDRFPTVRTLVPSSARNHGGSYRFFVRCFFSQTCVYHRSSLHDFAPNYRNIITHRNEKERNMIRNHCSKNNRFFRPNDPKFMII